MFFGKEFRTAFEKMTDSDPTRRPSLKEIKNFEWFKRGTLGPEELKLCMKEKLKDI